MSETDDDEGSTRTLHQRLLDAQEDCPDVKKTGEAPEKIGGYKYLEDTAVTPVASQILRKHGLVLDPEMVDIIHPPESDLLKVKWCMRLHCPATGETMERSWYSEGKGGSDKHISKAATMARKDYARLLLQIPGGAEAEADATSGGAESASESQQGGTPTSSGDKARWEFHPDNGLLNRHKEQLDDMGWNNAEGESHYYGYFTPAEAVQHKEELKELGTVKKGGGS